MIEPLFWISLVVLALAAIGLLVTAFGVGRFPERAKWSRAFLGLLGTITGIEFAWAFFWGIAIQGRESYWFVWPFIAQAAIVLALAVLGYVRESRRRTFLWCALVLFGLLFLPAWFAMEKWPGGDDGPGLGWGFLVMAPTFLGMALTPVFALEVLIGHLVHRRRDAALRADRPLPSVPAP